MCLLSNGAARLTSGVLTTWALSVLFPASPPSGADASVPCRDPSLLLLFMSPSYRRIPHQSSFVFGPSLSESWPSVKGPSAGTLLMSPVVHHRPQGFNCRHQASRGNRRTSKGFSKSAEVRIQDDSRASSFGCCLEVLLGENRSSHCVTRRYDAHVASANARRLQPSYGHLCRCRFST